MICPKCGQEIIDRKEFCINCGERLYKSKTISKKTLIFIFIGMVVFGILLCYAIINFNTNGELNPYINQSNTIK